MIKYLYNDSKCSVSFCGANSSLLNISQGVGQGRVLSAFIFFVYINDLLSEICQNNNGLCLGDINIPGILLAVDTAIKMINSKDIYNVYLSRQNKMHLHGDFITFINFPSKSVFIVSCSVSQINTPFGS